MSEQLENFSKERIVYSGRIDDFIKQGDINKLKDAKNEYQNILNKYIDIACDLLSEHTNKPFTVYEYQNGEKVFRERHKVLKDVRSMEISLEEINLDNKVKKDIRNALNVVIDYYDKILINERDLKVNNIDTFFKFRLLFSLVLAPIICFVIALIKQKICSINPDILVFLSGDYSKVSLSTGNLLLILLYYLSLLGGFGFLLFLYCNFMNKSIMNNKKFMIYPTGIIILFSLFFPNNLLMILLTKIGIISLNSTNFFLQVFLSFKNFMITIFTILTLFSIFGRSYYGGDYKEPLVWYEIPIVIFNVITSIIFLTIFVLSNIILSGLAANAILTIFYFLLNIIKYIYLIYLILLINIEIVANNQKKGTNIILSIIISDISLLSLVALDILNNIFNFSLLN